MARGFKSRPRCTFLHDFSGIHHCDLIRDTRNEAEIMRHQNQGNVQLTPQIGEQVQDLRLDRYVERGCRFIRNDQLRLALQRHGDHDTLAQTARELMGILRQTAFSRGDADLAQEF
jgi:hypothetical protein